MRKPRNSRRLTGRISNRYAGIIFLVGLFPFLGLTLYTIWAIRGWTESAAEQILEQSTVVIMDRIDEWLQSELELTAQMASLLGGLLDWENPAGVSSVLEAKLALLARENAVYIERVCIANGKGEVLASTLPQAELGEVGHHPWHTTPLLTGREGFTIMEKPGVSNQFQVAFSAPILSNDAPLGVLCVVFNGQKLHEFLIEISPAGLGARRSYLIDSENRILARGSMRALARLEPLAEQHFARELLNSIPDHGGFFTFHPTQRIGGEPATWAVNAYQHPTNQLTVLHMQSAETLFQPVEDQILLVLLVAAGFLLALLCLGYLAGSNIGQRFQTLSEAVEAIASGQLTSRLPVGARDEWGVVVGAFNRMAETIQERTQALEAAREEAEKASKAKSHFLAVMSHEIRTPLNSIIGYNRILSNQRQLASSSRQMAESARRAGERLLEMVNTMLDYTSIESGRKEIHPQPFDPLVCLSEVLEVTGPQAWAKGLEIVVQPFPPFPERVVADGVRIRQILTNLVGNAVKFTDAGGVWIGIQYSGEPKVGDGLGELSLRIRDSGNGIPPAVQETLFEAFQSGDSSTRRKHGGTGLGLAISRKLTELQGGCLRMESTGPSGTTFSLRIPVAHCETEVIEFPMAVESGLTFQIFSNNSFNRQFYVETLEYAGFRATNANPSFFVVDLPGIQGKPLGEIPGVPNLGKVQIPAILIHPATGERENGQPLEAPCFAATEEILRPVLPWELVSAVNNLVKRSLLA